MGQQHVPVVRIFPSQDEISCQDKGFNRTDTLQSSIVFTGVRLRTDSSFKINQY